MSIENVLYIAKATSTGGRDGRAVSSDNVLDIPLSTPRELGGAGGRGTIPNSCLPPPTPLASSAR